MSLFNSFFVICSWYNLSALIITQKYPIINEKKPRRKCNHRGLYLYLILLFYDAIDIRHGSKIEPPTTAADISKAR